MVSGSGWSRLLVAAVVLAAMAGCASSGPPAETTGTPPPEPAHRPSLVLPWTAKSCRFLAAIASVPAAKVNPYLPPGFRALSSAQIGLPAAPNPSNDATFGIEAFVCESGDGLNGSFSPFMMGSFSSAVEPPAALKKVGVTYHFVKWDNLVPDEPRRLLLQAYGVRSWNGTTGIIIVNPNQEMTGAFVRFNATETHYITVGAPLVPQDPGSFVDFSNAKDGLAVWHTRYSWVKGGIGPATVRAAPGSFAEQILGAGEIAAVAFGGTIHLEGGTVTLPAQAPTSGE